MRKSYTVAVAGATGLVGRTMTTVLEEQNFPVGRLVPLASARSAGMEVLFHGSTRESADFFPATVLQELISHFFLPAQAQAKNFHLKQ